MRGRPLLLTLVKGVEPTRSIATRAAVSPPVTSVVH